MDIMIIGAGKVGYTLAMHLTQEGNNITVIDNNPKALIKVEDELDVMPIKGNGISTSTLLDAGCNGADLVIAVTNSDEVNMLCCLTAKKLGAKRTVARIRNPHYARELLLIKEDLGLDMVINPEEACADEIARTLMIPGAIKMENFAKGRVRMVEVCVKGNMPIAGMKIKDINDKFEVPILIGAISRNKQLIIPNGDHTVEVGDFIYAVGKSANVYSFCKRLQNGSAGKIKNVMIVGGGKIAYYLARLLNEMNIKVKIIESNEKVCLELAEELPNTLIIQGDGTDSNLLQSEHLEAADSFITLTGHDESNIIASLIAREYEVKRIITKISKSNCNGIINKLGIDTVVSPQDIISNHIVKYVRGSSIEALHRMVGGQGEVIEFIVSKEDGITNTPLHKIKLIPEVLITTIVRRDEVVIPNGNDMIYEGDRILVITKNNIAQLKDIVIMTTGGLTSELKNSIKKLGNAIGM